MSRHPVVHSAMPPPTGVILTGAKIGDIIGRRRAFMIGLVIYGCGSAMTAASQTIAVLALGRSILEGLGAAMVLPALAALIAGNYEGRERKVAYAVIGGAASAGIAIGPILGGWATTDLSWRIVFAGEVVLCLVILAMSRLIGDAPRADRIPHLDYVGTVLSAPTATSPRRWHSAARRCGIPQLVLPAMGASMRSLGLQLAGGPECRQQPRR